MPLSGGVKLMPTVAPVDEPAIVCGVETEKPPGPVTVQTAVTVSLAPAGSVMLPVTLTTPPSFGHAGQLRRSADLGATLATDTVNGVALAVFVTALSSSLARKVNV